MKPILSILVLIFLISCGDQMHNTQPLSIDLQSEIVNPKHYIITKTNEPIVIDGIENESSWQHALYSDSFIDIEGVKIPKYDTKMKMLWDESYLYVYAQLQEPHIWGDLKQRDTVIYYNNDFEVFISPSGTTRNYAEIEINALGTVWDLLLNKPYRDHGKANNHWNLNDLKTAIQINGTLNDFSDIDSMWTVEMAIPMRALLELKNRPRTLPKEGEQWRINFSRVNWDYDIVNGAYKRKKDEDGKYKPEYNWVWSNQNVINMHEPEKWGYLQFTNDTSSSKTSFIADENNVLKQVCFALFRQTKFGSLKALTKENIGSTQTISVKYSESDSLKAAFYKTNFGFEYKLNSEKTNQSFIINETGTLKVK
ncbi:MAG: carbohydrate-binding family 9-like protein [Bacteroidia bacterium]|nr:carbohydrate-binding family 9-like protein [Bacteroidia bacterium]